LVDQFFAANRGQDLPAQGFIAADGAGLVGNASLEDIYVSNPSPLLMQWHNG
jgi:hypothetical protein